MFRNLSVGIRASGAFGLIGVIVLAMGIFAIAQLNSVSEQLAQITEQQIPSTEQINGIDREFLRVRVHTANIAAADSASGRQKYTAKLEDAKQNMQSHHQQLKQLADSAKAKQLIADYEQLQNQYWNIQKQFLNLINSGQTSAALSLRDNQQLPLTNKISTLLDDLVDYQKREVNEASAMAEDIRKSAGLWLIVVVVITLSLLAAFAWLLTRSIVDPLRQAVDVAHRIADRDLSQSFEVEGQDEPAQLLRELRKTQEELRNSLQTIAKSSEQLASTSEELNSVTDDSARTIQQQSNELEQAATAVNELTTAIENVARDAQAASESSVFADEKAQQGLAQVRETLDAIKELAGDMSVSSEQVGELADKVKEIVTVLDVIRGIADQTNLLALNAAIEAARAGESGRGFAVVADEVRALAHRTQQSTVEIENLIQSVQETSNNSVENIERSAEKAIKTLDVASDEGRSLEEIVTAVNDINNRNASIASAAEEQASVSKEVDRSLMSIRDLSNSTSSGAEQTNASATELSRLAVDLNNLINRFKL
ncbi:methyl-accepting chemotaxis protein [Idiomarina tyrosinivorans]|uniref:Methyl-accepting chemotaxis protein n=1 Tax=Idiomarina tyrosinivorans TaxID=1445662 RepID=A0A432ZSL4_9GAMM|nr:methyl-accepting chemotaxis protein [Idiomarina tyrosinivorans]RUO80852.1 methyl-accepting chemotaxis protein [Idiomarina tyrosinivorans]